MNYELLKTLKEVGYPQIPQTNYVVNHENVDEAVTDPTTDEIIEELGDTFDTLLRRDDKYEARGIYYCCDEHGEGKKIEEDSTPKEALIKLYTALNSVDNQATLR